MSNPLGSKRKLPRSLPHHDSMSRGNSAALPSIESISKQVPSSRPAIGQPARASAALVLGRAEQQHSFPLSFSSHILSLGPHSPIVHPQRPAIISVCFDSNKQTDIFFPYYRLATLARYVIHHLKLFYYIPSMSMSS